MKIIDVKREDFDGVAFGFYRRGKFIVFVDAFLNESAEYSETQNEIISYIERIISSKKYDIVRINCISTFKDVEAGNGLEMKVTRRPITYTLKYDIFDEKAFLYIGDGENCVLTHKLYIRCKGMDLSVNGINTEVMEIVSDDMHELEIKRCNLLVCSPPLIITSIPKGLEELKITATKLRSTDDIRSPYIFPKLEEVDFHGTRLYDFDPYRFPSLRIINLNRTRLSKFPDFSGHELESLSFKGTPAVKISGMINIKPHDSTDILPIGSEKTEEVRLRVITKRPEWVNFRIAANSLKSVEIDSDGIINSVSLYQAKNMDVIDCANFRAREIYIDGFFLSYIKKLIIPNYVKRLDLYNVVIEEILGGRGIEVFWFNVDDYNETGFKTILRPNSVDFSEIILPIPAMIYTRNTVRHIIENSERLKELKVSVPIPTADVLQIAEAIKSIKFDIIGYYVTISDWNDEKDRVSGVLRYMQGVSSLDQFIGEVKRMPSKEEIDLAKDDDEKIRLMNDALRVFDPTSPMLMEKFTINKNDSERIREVKGNVMKFFVKRQIGKVIM